MTAHPLYFTFSVKYSLLGRAKRAIFALELSDHAVYGSQYRFYEFLLFMSVVVD